MSPCRPCFAVLIALAAAACIVGSMAKEVRAADDPCHGLADETMRWIVPFSPGGGYDAYSRLLEPFLEARLGAEVVVINVAGAGGIVGAKQLRHAKPDGRTVGILHAASLIIAELTGSENSPRLTKDFTILGSFGTESEVWLTAAGSDIRTMDDVFAQAGRAPIVYGSAADASETWLTGAMGSAILGIEVDFVTGYKGSKERLLSLMRGEFDVTSNSWSSSRAYVEAGDLRLLAQISKAPIANHPALEGVPVLGGPDGIAVKRARALDRNPRAAQTQADALARITGAGRLIAAPRGLDPALASCLEEAAYEAMTDAQFKAALAKANRPIGATRGAETLRSIRAAIRDIKPFIAAAAE